MNRHDSFCCVIRAEFRWSALDRMSVSSSSESSVSAQLLQRAKSSGKLRFGKDKLLRTNSGGGRSPLLAAASSTSLASSDGEELTSWRVEARAAATSARRESPENDPFATTRSASAPVSRRTVQPPDTWACTSLADLDILATIGESPPTTRMAALDLYTHNSCIGDALTCLHPNCRQQV